MSGQLKLVIQIGTLRLVHFHMHKMMLIRLVCIYVCVSVRARQKRGSALKSLKVDS